MLQNRVSYLTMSPTGSSILIGGGVYATYTDQKEAGSTIATYTNNITATVTAVGTLMAARTRLRSPFQRRRSNA